MCIKKGLFPLFFLLAAVVFGDTGLEIIVEGDPSSGYTITRSRGSVKSLRIPERIGDTPIIAIGNGAFSGRGLSEVTIPENVRTIGDGAFANNNLRTIEIGENVTKLGIGAFTGNLLATVTLGEGLTEIGTGAFSNNRITSVNIPESVEIIGNYAFFNNRIRDIEFPENVAVIGEGAFSGNRLTSVSIGSGVTRIGDGAFYNNRITSINIEATLTIETLGRRTFDSRPADGRIQGNVNFIDSGGNVLQTIANNFNSRYFDNERRPGRYFLSTGGIWDYEES